MAEKKFKVKKRLLRSMKNQRKETKRFSIECRKTKPK